MQRKPAPTRNMFREGQINDVVVRELRKFNDSRGWLSELFRHDDLDPEFHPAMAYISSTKPRVTRGPHEHVDQADLFCFLGPSNFKLRMWDNRADSATHNNMMTLVVGAEMSVFPAASQEWIARQIPDARLEIFAEADGGSDFMCFENPIRFNAVVRDFLASLDHTR